MLESCRTAPALVRSVDEDRLAVAIRPLVWDGRALELGAWESRVVRWRDDGLALVSAPRPGDWVSLHWGFACDRLSPASTSSLQRATRRALAAVNRSSSSTAALA